MKPGRVITASRRALSLLRREGFISLGYKGFKKLHEKNERKNHKVSLKGFVSLVDANNVKEADWSNNRYEYQKRDSAPPYTINWVMSPPSGGGGHQNIFRFIEYTDKLGYTNNVYLYSNYDKMSLQQAKENVSSYCKAKNLTFHYYKNQKISGDVLFATGWETAYPVFNAKTDALKMYFVQDFEPFFYPVGTDYILAENTYKFGFPGITAGGWLDKKLSEDYGMTTYHYDFGADTKRYRHTNNKRRKEVFFYARPVTERRGFDLGIMALEIFHKKMPDYKINLAGWDVSDWDVPFPYVNHGAVNMDDLSEIYNKSAAALVMSLTNMSLLPLELLACGTIPVVNDAPNNRLVSNNKYINYADTSPQALADALIESVARKDQAEHALQASKSVAKDGWSVAGEKFVLAIEEELRRG